jgi:uncharacterized protein (DUF983 family)
VDDDLDEISPLVFVLVPVGLLVLIAAVWVGVALAVSSWLWMPYWLVLVLAVVWALDRLGRAPVPTPDPDAEQP